VLPKNLKGPKILTFVLVECRIWSVEDLGNALVILYFFGIT